MAAEPIHLYYFPTSFYSQKVLIALKERQLQYKETIVSLISGEVNTPWYLKMTTKGLVPALKIGDRVITESEAIIEAIDELPDGKGPRLIPDVTTAQGRLVQDWRRRLDAIPAENITYGVFLNSELHTPDIKIPKAMIQTRQSYKKIQMGVIKSLESLKKSNPDLSEAIDVKIAAARKRMRDDHLPLSQVRLWLEKCGETFDEVESQLTKMKAEHPAGHWLCGADFSAADINLSVLLGRLNHMGRLSQLLDPQKRPLLVEYWYMSRSRDTVKVTVDEVVRSLQKYLAKTYLPKLLGGTLAAGAVVLVGVFLAKRLNKV